MGWLFPILFAALSLAALARFGRLPRQALELAGALCLAAIAGYAWQGSPDLPGQPTSPAP